MIGLNFLEANFKPGNEKVAGGREATPANSAVDIASDSPDWRLMFIPTVITVTPCFLSPSARSILSEAGNKVLPTPDTTFTCKKEQEKEKAWLKV